MLACPRCLSALVCRRVGVFCPRCARLYPKVAGVYSFAGQGGEDRDAAVQAHIYDLKEERGHLLEPATPPPLGRYPDLLLTYREHARQVRRMRLPAGARVLELGCSTGTFLRSLRRDCGVEAHGVDVSMRSLVRAAQLAPDAHWYQASAHRLPFRDGSFDALFAFDVLEHVGDYSGAIQAIARVLRPGGVALLHVPVSDIEGSFDAIWKTHWPARYWAEQAQAGHAAAHMRSKRELMHDCDAVGLRVERVTRFNVLLQNIFDYRSRHRILGRAFNGRRIPFGVYHRLVAPFIELFTVVPDRALAAAADIGASVYLRVRRDGNVPAARTDPVHVAVADAEAAP